MAKFEISYVIGQEYRACIEADKLDDVLEACERGEFDGVGIEGDIYRAVTWWNAPNWASEEVHYVVKSEAKND